MAKIEVIKNENIELKLYASAMVFVAFKKTYETSLDKYFKDHGNDMEALAFVVQKAYESACKITNEDVKYSIDDILLYLSIEDLTDAIAKIFPTEKVVGEPQKKTGVKKT